MKASLLIDITGWVGVALLLLAYALVSTRKVQGDSMTYQFLNMLGGTLLIVNSFHYKAFPSVGVNVAWIGIAIYSMIRTRRGAFESD